MSRRRLSKPSSVDSDRVARPSLEKVLDHYGVDYSTSRVRQMIRCPIHGDIATPSCSLDLDKELFNCHSCGAAGDSWTLIMQKEGIDFDRARKFAAGLGLADGDVGGRDIEVRGRYDRSGGSVSARTRTNARDGAYKPAWRRR